MFVVPTKLVPVPQPAPKRATCVPQLLWTSTQALPVAFISDKLAVPVRVIPQVSSHSMYHLAIVIYATFLKVSCRCVPS